MLALATMCILSLDRKRLTGAPCVTFLAVSLIWLFAAGCGGVSYQIIRQTTPNPLLGKSQFVSMPVDYSNLRVGEKTEQEYLASKGGSSADSFQADKEAIDKIFRVSLAQHAGEIGITVSPPAPDVQTLAVKPHIGFIEPGYYAGIVGAPSKIEMTVVISDEHGTDLEEIFVANGTQSTLTNPSSGGRLRADAAALGEYVAAYLRDRTSGRK